jgi:hypothetical protein
VSSRRDTAAVVFVMTMVFVFLSLIMYLILETKWFAP